MRVHRLPLLRDWRKSEHPPRDVPVTYGENRATCPVRCWRAWQDAKLAAGADPGGPAFLPVDQWGHLGTKRLSPDGVGRALRAVRGPDRAPNHRPLRPAHAGHPRHQDRQARRQAAPSGRLVRQQPGVWEYVDEGAMFEDAPTEGIGL